MAPRSISLFLALAASSCGDSPDGERGGEDGSSGTAALEVVSLAEVEWAPLNPARGDSGPKAADLWGDRTGVGASGFLVEFVDGFSSPPHIHNVSYRAVVLDGLVHNDDPGAENMWMPQGSFWTQPKGGVHITSASGIRNLAYVEIESGPYLVQPVEEAFDAGERPINVDPSTMVWLSLAEGEGGASGPKCAYLWGSPEGDALRGAMIRLPAGFDGTIEGPDGAFVAVVVRGRIRHRGQGEAPDRELDPGSHFGSRGKGRHRITCLGAEDCLVYVRSRGSFTVEAGL